MFVVRKLFYLSRKIAVTIFATTESGKTLVASARENEKKRNIKMAKAKNLNGLPANLAQSYLSTLGYFNGGYMADWINFIAQENNIGEVEIDILNKKIVPKEFEVEALLSDLMKLRNIIEVELKNNGFEITFIKNAKLNFRIPIKNGNSTVYCLPQIEDENGKIYKPKNEIIETAYETNFNPKEIKNKCL